MKKDKKSHNYILNDKGSTLITVIVAIGFVTILTAIILSTTLMNVRMKAVDRRSKDNFYYAERALNDVYTEIGQAVQNQAASAYEAAFISVGRTLKEDFGTKNPDGTLKGEETFDFKTSEKAQEYYKKKFIANMSTWLNGITKDPSTNESTQLEGYIVRAAGKDYKIYVGSAVNEYYDDTNTSICGVRLKDVSVVAIDTNLNEYSRISTDIVILIPELSFLGTNADVSEYSVIANKGLVTNGNLKIEGNVYVGTNGAAAADGNTYQTETSGIHVNKGHTELYGDRIISKGDILVGSGKTESTEAQLTVGNSTHTTDLWVDSIKTVKNSTIPASDNTISINANVFALNDLELNCDKSKVAISGNYYGYNDGRLKETDTVASLDFDKKDSKNHNDSSAIIINGNEASLEMKDIASFVLMGKAYIEPNDDAEVSTAEGVALKTNQQLYLVPTDFLSCSNPTSNAGDFVKNANGKYVITIPSGWFGAKYLKKSSDSDNEYEINVVQIGSAYYAFLEFDDEDMFFAELSDTDENVETGEIVRKHDVIVDGKVDGSKSVDERKSGKKYSAGFSARTGFIKEVMNGQEKTKVNSSGDVELDEAKPTAKQLRRRINLSISNSSNGAFNLQKCVILDDTSTDDYKKKNVYSKNAVVSYYPYPAESITNGEKFEIKAIFNTAAKNRYSGYPENLFWRFKWLCANLDGKDSVPLSGSIGTKPDGDKKDESGNIETDESGNNKKEYQIPGQEGFEWKIDSQYPFVSVIGLNASDNVTKTKNAGIGVDFDGAKSVNSEVPDTGTYGEFVHLPAGSTLNKNVKGFVLCDGDLSVGSDSQKVIVKGTIIANGVITFNNAEVISDTSIIQKRIDKEMELVRKSGGYYRDDYLISYLIDENGLLKYQAPVSNDGYQTMKSDKVTFSYEDYMRFDNWQKGVNRNE